MTATSKTPVTFIFDSFGNGPNGTMPKGDLIADSDGNLFGTTSQGGPGYPGGATMAARCSRSAAGALFR